MDGGRTTKRQYSEYSEKKLTTQREDDRDNQWDITSDGPDSTTSGSDIPEGHYDRPPEEEYSDIPTTGESSGMAAAGHDRSPYIAQAHDADSGLRTPDRLWTPDSGLRRKKIRLYLNPDDHMIDI